MYKYLPFLIALSLLATTSCRHKDDIVANKATAQGGLTITNNTAYQMFLNFRAHDAVNPNFCTLQGGSLMVNAQSVMTFNSPADMNTSPGWGGVNANYYTAPGDWDGVKGGFVGPGDGTEIGNVSSCALDSSWSKYYPALGITLHLTWRHVNGAYELKAY